MAVAAESRFITAPDGLKLHVRDYGDRLGARLPAVCLPGLSRTAEDFEVLATALAGDAAAPRRVLSLDLRGRGLSAWDPNPKNYTVATELDDVLAVLTALEAAPAIIIGTSRGGLIAMAMAARQPGAIAAAVLNDIGPVIEAQGLSRIRGYVGQLPQPRSFAEGAEILRGISGGQFPNLTAADWLAAARRGWREQDGRLVTTYDPALAQNFTASADTPVPTLWPQFEALTQKPVMVIRGANSDILAADTVAEMKTRHPRMQVVEIADQGHAPLLAEAGIIARIAHFAAANDAAHGISGSVG